MRKSSFKGRCEKRKISKCKEILKTYDSIQSAYADVLNEMDDIVDIRSNVVLEDIEGGEYMSDLVCTDSSGDIHVCECVYRKLLTKPMTIKLLDISREYWLKRGADWRLIIDEEK